MRFLPQRIRGRFVGVVPILSIVVFALAGCVPFETYERTASQLEALTKAHNELAERYARLASSRETAGLAAPVPASAGVERDWQALRDREDEVHALRARISELESSGGETARFPSTAADTIPGAKVGSKGQLVLGDSILFNSGSTSLKRGGRSALDGLARLIRTEYPGETFHIVGHTDNVPLNKVRQLYDYNVKLGFERAFTVFKYLNIEHGIPEEQVRLHSSGFTEPAESNATDAGRARNRRVEIFRSGYRI